jgi:NADH-quinone oxidoreductase subunit L
MYVRAPGTSMRLAERLRGLHGFLSHKWYFDELYDASLVRPTRSFGAWAASVFERVVVGGLVSGTALAVRAGNSIVRVAQTGVVRNYALLLMTGVAALALYFLVVSR